jgi:hypothetical protein
MTVTRAEQRLIGKTETLKTAFAAEHLSAVLGCDVTPAAAPGTVEARGLPGVYSLIGTPEEVAAEGRRVLLGQWLRVLGRQGRPA